MNLRPVSRRLLTAAGLFIRPANLPGYQQMPWPTRLFLNGRALLAFSRTGECVRLLAYLTIWQLAAHIGVWQLDLTAAPAYAPPLLACLWVWPWLADARCRHIHLQLGGRWPV